MITLTSDGYTLQCAHCVTAIDLESGSAALGRWVLAHSTPLSLAHVDTLPPLHPVTRTAMRYAEGTR